MSKKEHEKFDRELLADDPSAQSHGTGNLMALMGVRGPGPSVPIGRRPAEREEDEE